MTRSELKAELIKNGEFNETSSKEIASIIESDFVRITRILYIVYLDNYLYAVLKDYNPEDYPETSSTYLIREKDYHIGELPMEGLNVVRGKLAKSEEIIELQMGEDGLLHATWPAPQPVENVNSPRSIPEEEGYKGLDDILVVVLEVNNSVEIS